MKYTLIEDKKYKGYYKLVVDYPSPTSKSSIKIESGEVKTFNEWSEFLGMNKEELIIKKS